MALCQGIMKVRVDFSYSLLRQQSDQSCACDEGICPMPRYFFDESPSNGQTQKQGKQNNGRLRNSIELRGIGDNGN